MADVSQYIGGSISSSIVPVVTLIGAEVAARRAARTGGDPHERRWRWWIGGGMVVGPVIVAVAFVVATSFMATSIGYTPSPFQFEVATANLGFAVAGLLCLRRPAGRLAAAVGYSVFLLGALAGHVYELVAHGNHEPGNVGGIWLYDALVPAALLLLARADLTRERARAGRSAR